MDNNNPYNIAPPMQAPYDPSQFNTTADFVQSRIRPQLMAPPPVQMGPPPSAITPAAAAPTTKTPTKWQAFLMEHGVKTPEDFDKARDKFKLALEAGLYGEKFTKDGVEAKLRQFDAQAEEDKAALGLSGATTAGAGGTGAGKDNANFASENLAAFGIGAAQVIPGALNLADLLYRDLRGMVQVTNSGKREDYNLGEKTAVGRAADKMSGKLNAALLARTSSETLAQQKDIEEKLRARGVPESRLAGYMDTIGEYLDPAHYRALALQASGGASTFLPMMGTAKLLGGAAKLGKLGTAERVLRVGAPTGAAFAARSESEFEDRVRKTDIETLLKDRPDLAAVYNVAGDINAKAEAAKTIKQHIIDQGSAGVFAGNFLANAALPAIPGFGGIERFAAAGGQRAVGKTINALKTGASEWGEETVAGGTQDISQNQVLGRPAFEGAGANAAISGLAGFAGGAVAGGFERTPSQTKKSLKKPAATATGTPNAPATAPGDIGDTAAVGPYANPAAAPMGPDAFVKLTTDVDERLDRLTPTFKKKFANASEPIHIIQGAEAIAQKVAGDAWATLDTAQRLSLVEKAAAAINTKKAINGLGEQLAAYKAQVVTPGPAQPAPLTDTLKEGDIPADLRGTPTPADALKGFGAGIADGLYQGAFDALAKGDTTSTFTKESFWPALKAAYDAGTIKTAADVKALINPQTAAPSPLANIQNKTLGELTNNLNSPEGQAAQSATALILNLSAPKNAPIKYTAAQIEKMTVAEALAAIEAMRPKRAAETDKPVVPPLTLDEATALRKQIAAEFNMPPTMVAEIPKDGLRAEYARLAAAKAQTTGIPIADQILPAPAVTPPVQTTTRGRLKKEPVAEPAKTQASIDQDTSGVLDTRLVSFVLNDQKKANRADKKEAKRMVQELEESGMMTRPEMLASTLPQLRLAHEKLKRAGAVVIPAVENKPKSKGKKRTGTKTFPNAATKTPNDTENMPVGKNSEVKVSGVKNISGSSYGSAKVSALLAETFGKATAGKTAQNKATAILNRLNTLREQGTKGIPSEKAMGDWTYDQLVQAETDILDAQIKEAAKEEKSRNLKKKTEAEQAAKDAELKKQQAVAPTELERALTSIHNLTTEEPGKLSEKRLSKSVAESLMDTFRAGLKTGRFGELQVALTKAGVFKPHIDKVISQAKEARAAEMSRFEGFRNAEGALLTKGQRDKLANLYFDYTDGTISLTKFRKGVQAITFDETGNGPEKVLVETAAREKAVVANVTEEAPPPKTQAPLTEGAESKKPSKTKASKTAPKKSTAEQISERLPDLTAKQRTEILNAVESGDVDLLNEELTNLLDREDITKEDAVFLRKLVAEPVVATREALSETVDSLLAENSEEDLAPEETTLDDVGRNLRLRLDVAANPRTPAVDKILPAPQGKKVRVIEWLRAFRKEPRFRAGVDFALWLIEQNPNIAGNNLTIQIANPQQLRVLLDDEDAGSVQGVYDSLTRIIHIATSLAKMTTIVHEILHHSERLLPQELRDKIRAEYEARFLNKIKQVEGWGDSKRKTNALAFLKATQEYNAILKEGTEAEVEVAYTKALQAFEKVHSNSFYKYLDVSEYWAEEGSRILNRSYNEGSWIGKLRNWMQDFINYIRGIDTKQAAAIAEGLENILNNQGEFVSEKLLNESSEATARDTSKKEKAPSIDDVTTVIPKFQRAWEKLANNVLGFEEFEIQLRKLGVNLSLVESPTGLASKYNSDVSRNNEIDMAQVSDPVKNWLADNHNRFDADFPNFLSNVNRYFGNKHMLETLRRYWWESVPLNNYGRELERQDILEAFDNEEISPDEFRKKMVALANNYGKVKFDRYAVDNGMSPEMFDSIQRTLDEMASEYGMTDEAMDELNELLDPVRQRQIDRMIESGAVSKKDRWIAAYDYKYYVPLKGTGRETDAALGDFDFIPADRIALAKLNQTIHVADGRNTFAEKPFERLFVDLARSGERAAWNHMAEGIYNIVAENQKLLKAKIEVWRGTPKGGYTNGETNVDGELKLHSSLPRPLDGIVYSDGNVHYVARLPEHSQLLRGLKAMTSVARPPTWVSFVGKGTSILGRAYTTLSPFWATAKGFIRDWTTIPITIAVENFDNPVAAGKFLLQYPIEMMKLYKALPTLMATVKGDTNEMLRMAEENPTGYAAKVKRYLDAGGANNFTEGFELSKSDKIFKQSYKTVDGIWEGAKLAGSDVFKYTGNWANFLENMTRVAAHEALMTSTDMDATDAALRVRRVLDYAKTGTWGRNINAFTAFYRTGMTSADTFRRAFRKPLGGTDWKKLATWSATLSALSMVAYFVVGAAMGDDDELDEEGKPILDEDGKPIRVAKIAKIKPQTLTQKMFVPVGDKVYGVELGLGFPQVLMAPGVLGAAVAQGHITMGEAAGEFWNVINRNGPARLAGMRGGITTIGQDPTNFLTATLLSMTPTLAAPLFAKDRNLNAFDMPIHRENYDKDKPRYAQAMANTPKEFIDMSRWLYENANGVDMYPEDLKFLASNYGGQNVSDLFKATLDIAHKNTLGEDAHYNVATSRFEIQDLDYYAQNDMYDTTDAIGEIKQKYNAAKQNAILDGSSEDDAQRIADKMLNENPQDKAAIKAADDIKKAITARGKALKKLGSDNTLSPTRKQLMRKQLDSDLRKLTLKAKYLLEKAQ